MNVAPPAAALTSADVVYYGNYPQSGLSPDFTVEPIVWRVLEAGGDQALLLSERILDGGLPFNPKDSDKELVPEDSYFHVPYSSWWSESPIRKFLNGDAYEKSPAPKLEVKNPKGYAFYEKAFSRGEASPIIKAKLDNSVRADYHTNFDAGPETEDKIFLLSYADVEPSDKAEARGKKYGFVVVGVDIDSGFVDNKSRRAGLTSYSAAQGVYGDTKSGLWWLRSPGHGKYMVSNVSDYNGGCGFLGVSHENAGLRPAFRLNLESLLFTSPAKGGKAGGVEATLKKQAYDGTYTHAPSSRDFTEHKLTLATNTYKLATADVTSGAILAGTNIDVAVTYTGASTGAGYHLATVVTSGDRALYYGQIKGLETADDESGTATFTIPEYNAGEEVYVFVEGNNNNGNYKTDFAGVPICLTGSSREIKTLSSDVSLDLQSIFITPASLNLIAGKTAPLAVSYRPAEAAREEITWGSGASDIVSVDGGGIITAHKTGTAVITATTKSGKTATCSITVTPPSEGLNLNIPKMTLAKKETMEISAFLCPEGTSETITDITWTASDGKILTVTPDETERTKAKITALAAGEATITVKAKSSEGRDYEKSVEIAVTAAPAPALKPSGGSGGCNSAPFAPLALLLLFPCLFFKKDKS